MTPEPCYACKLTRRPCILHRPGSPLESKDPHDHVLNSNKETNPLPGSVSSTQLDQHDHETQKLKTLAAWSQVDTCEECLKARSWGVYREALFSYVMQLEYPAVISVIRQVAQTPSNTKGKLLNHILKQKVEALKKGKKKQHTIVYSW